ncbi:MAG: winged helix-turn-helix transcriptional regulator [archaeon]
MKLRRPTDFLILGALDAHGRNVATNLAHHTGKSRKNVNTRLPVLEDYGLVRKIGPAERSGLYEITERGRTALAYRDRYDDVEDFGALIDRSKPPGDDGPGNPGPSGVALARSENGRADETDSERNEG